MKLSSSFIWRIIGIMVLLASIHLHANHWLPVWCVRSKTALPHLPCGHFVFLPALELICRLLQYFRTFPYFGWTEQGQYKPEHGHRHWRVNGRETRKRFRPYRNSIFRWLHRMCFIFSYRCSHSDKYLQLGPLLGAWMTLGRNDDSHSCFQYMPPLIALVLSLANLFFSYFYLPETLSISKRVSHNKIIIAILHMLTIRFPLISGFINWFWLKRCFQLH